jgi:hypothetical protein
MLNASVRVGFGFSRRHACNEKIHVISVKDVILSPIASVEELRGSIPFPRRSPVSTPRRVLDTMMAGGAATSDVTIVNASYVDVTNSSLCHAEMLVNQLQQLIRGQIQSC